MPAERQLESVEQPGLPADDAKAPLHFSLRAVLIHVALGCALLAAVFQVPTSYAVPVLNTAFIAILVILTVATCRRGRGALQRWVSAGQLVIFGCGYAYALTEHYRLAELRRDNVARAIHTGMILLDVRNNDGTPLAQQAGWEEHVREMIADAYREAFLFAGLASLALAVIGPPIGWLIYRATRLADASLARAQPYSRSDCRRTSGRTSP